MVEEVAAGIYRIGVPLPGNPLKELNSYFISGKDRELVIDTGFRCPECKEALTEGLKKLGSHPEKRDVVLTHFHSDHSGISCDIASKTGKIYISENDYRYLGWSLDGTLENYSDGYLTSEGFPLEQLKIAGRSNMAFRNQMERFDERLERVAEGDILQAGDYSLKVVSVPGHTPGNSMLWDEKHGIMFTGDHVLFDISPNITSWYKVKDSLSMYLDSLHKALQYDVKQALPGHRKPGNYRERIEELLEHHRRRIAECKKCVESMPGLTAYDIAGHMKWKIRAKNWDEFPPVQKCFAVRECLAHLDYLRNRGEVRREEKDGRWYYFVA